MITILLASNNEKKAQEMRVLLPAGYDVLTASQGHISMPAETGRTFEENALLKARAAAQQSGYLCVADDSGLEVDSLDGAPGVRSARFASDHGRAESDEENNFLLLELLRNVPEPERTARFVSAVAIVTPDGYEHVVRGTIEGRIGTQPRGSNGFGYDPLFIPEFCERTIAELDPEQKNRISHRGRAFRNALPELVRLTGP